MRICLETSTFRARLAGIAYYTLFLADHLLAVQEDIELSGFDGNAFSSLSAESLDRIRNGPEGGGETRAAGLYHRARQFRPAREAFRAYKALRFRGGAGRFDLFHAMNFMPPAETGIPVLPLVHDISHERFPEAHPAERTHWLRKRLAHLDRYPLVNTVSSFSADEIARFYGYPRHRIRVTHPGVNPIFRGPAPATTNAMLDRLELRAGHFFLSVGTMEPRKNHATLFAAYALLGAGIRRRFPLVHVGQPGWGKGEPQHLAALVAEGGVRMLGYADEATLRGLYASARALLFPTLYEGFGIPVAEAMASGLPAIVSDIDVMHEVTGGMADFVAPLDADGWAAAIMRAAESSADGISGRKAAAQRASERFDWAETARETAAIYRELV